VQSVELLLDDAADAEIRRQWQLLADAGISSLASAGSPGKGDAETNRPHITVAVARQIWPRIDQALDALAFRPIPIRLGGLLVFGARHPILVRNVVPSEQLLAVQRRIFTTVAPCPDIPANLHPDAWTPIIVRDLREAHGNDFELARQLDGSVLRGHRLEVIPGRRKGYSREARELLAESRPEVRMGIDPCADRRTALGESQQPRLIQFNPRFEIVLRRAGNYHADVDELFPLDPRNDADDSVIVTIMIGHELPPQGNHAATAAGSTDSQRKPADVACYH